MIRFEITEAVDIVKELAAGLVDDADGLLVEGVGSYRRGKADSGDIDVLISHIDGRSHVGLLQKLVEQLRTDGRLIATLSNPADKKGWAAGGPAAAAAAGEGSPGKRQKTTAMEVRECRLRRTLAMHRRDPLSCLFTTWTILQ